MARPQAGWPCFSSPALPTAKYPPAARQQNFFWYGASFLSSLYPHATSQGSSILFSKAAEGLALASEVPHARWPALWPPVSTFSLTPWVVLGKTLLPEG